MGKPLKISLFLVVIMLVGCKCPKDYIIKQDNFFYIQHTSIDRLDPRVPCGFELINKINTQWLRHGKNDYYYYNSLLLDIKFNYEFCMIGLSKELILDLFGQPQDTENSQVTYIASAGGDNYKTLYHYMTFVFDDSNKVVSVQISG